MSPRLAGAMLALTAAALLALSLVTSAWWAGHPQVNGQTIDAKTVHVGLHGAEGCNTGGDGGCTELEMPDGFTLTGYAVLGVGALLAITAVLVGISTLRGAEGRIALAKVVLAVAIGAAAVAIALIVQGPKVKATTHVGLPIGYGTFVYFGGVVFAIGASVLARRPLPKIELRPSRQAIAPGLAPPPPASAQPVDVLALLQQDTLRPTAIAPQAGDGLAGPAGPLGSPQSAPLFSSAPQLRPLYDAGPAQGGTSGYVPGAPPVLPMRGPTPLPHAAVSAVIGIPTPPPPPPVVPPVASHQMIEQRTKPASVAPPPPVRTRAQSVPPPPGAIAARLKASSVPPPIRAKAPTVPPPGPKPLAATAVPPAPASPKVPAAPKTPTIPKTLAGAVMPAPPVVSAKLPVRAVTDPADHLETVERPREDIGDTTDANVVLPPADTEQGPAVARPHTETDDVETSAVDKVARESASELETIARERLSARELATGDSTSETAPAEATANETPAPELVAPAPAVIAPPVAAPAVVAPPVAAAAPAAAPNIPITTAPDSLPPPTEKQAATSGPSPACPQCEAPMAWVEEHLRFYCKSCRMYF